MNLFLIFLFLKGHSQCSLYEVPLKEKTEASSLIIEGKVINRKSFWNEEETMIYTSNKIEVYKIIKGILNKNEIEVITSGGQVGDFMIKTSSLLTLNNEDQGIFLLNLSNKKIDSYEVVASRQGFIRYYFDEDKATDVFHNYFPLKNALKELASITGEDVREIKNVPDHSHKQNQSSAIPIISDFFPLSLSSGTKTRLTINGSGFGTLPTVKFKNANDGGSTYIEPLSTQYISRNDNQVIVEVPFNAGTGRIQVVNGVTALSTVSLDVSYSYSNLDHENFYHQARFVNRGGGGYVWQMFSDFDQNEDAKEAFLRAFGRWRCESMVNWTIGDITSIDKTEKDNINTIRFDNGSELPSGVLGICYSYYSSCTFGKWYVAELDIIFNDNTNWNYSIGNPFSNQFDLETIAFHELGHGHQMGHVINSSDLMHYNISAGMSKRSLNDNNRACAALVMGNSTTSQICSQSPMLAVTPDVCEDETFGFFEFDEITLGPNPFNDIVTISYQIAAESEVKAEIFDLFGNRVLVLFDETQKPGKYIRGLSKNELEIMNTGLYILRLTLNGNEHTKKMIKVEF